MEGGEAKPNRDELSESTLRQEISNRIASLYQRYYGSGPERVKTHLHEDSVLCLLRGGATRMEQTLSEAKKHKDAEALRSAFQDAVENPFRTAIAELTGRNVITYFSANRPDEDVSIEVFVFEERPG